MRFIQDGGEHPFHLQPDPYPIKARWIMEGFPSESEGSEIRWSSSYSLAGKPDVGSGSAPTLYVKYVLNLTDTGDKMPPGNRWFGKKTLVLSIGDQLVIRRKVTCSFDSDTEYKKLFGDSKVTAWYYYYVLEQVVPGLDKFYYSEEYLDLLGGVACYHYYLKLFFISKDAALKVQKKAFIVADKFTETDYPINLAIGSHGVAKVCRHEEWHKQLDEEIQREWVPSPAGSGGTWRVLNDDDGDLLCNEREKELRSDPDIIDSFELTSMYSAYSTYADCEVFCRLMEKDEVLGVESKDWLTTGPQIQKMLQ